MKLTIGCWDIQDRILDPDVQRYLRSRGTGVDVWMLFNGFAKVRAPYIDDVLAAHFEEFAGGSFLDDGADSGTVVLVRTSVLPHYSVQALFPIGGATGLASVSFGGRTIIGMSDDDHTDITRFVDYINNFWVDGASLDRTVVVGNCDTGRSRLFPKLPKEWRLLESTKSNHIWLGCDARLSSISIGDMGAPHHRPIFISVDVP